MAFHDKESIKLSKVGAIEITQWQRELTALREVPGSVPSTYMAAHNYV